MLCIYILLYAEQLSQLTNLLACVSPHTSHRGSSAWFGLEQGGDRGKALYPLCVRWQVCARRVLVLQLQPSVSKEEGGSDGDADEVEAWMHTVR